MTPQGPGTSKPDVDAEGSAPVPASAGPPRLDELLGEHCRRIAADGGAVLRVARDGRVDIAALWPAPEASEEPPAWLREAVVSAGQAAATGSAVTTKGLPGESDLYGQAARRHLVMVPLPGAGGLAVFVAETPDPAELARRAGQAAVCVNALGLYGLHVATAGPAAASGPLAGVLANLAAVNEHDRFLPAAMAFCNEVAAAWRCERVSLGFVEAPQVELKAMSHTEKFNRQTRIAQLIEAAMEECLDQDMEVYHPAGRDAEFVDRAARELSAEGGSSAVLSVPLRRGGKVVAAATLERPADSPFGAGEVESIRLACELVTPRLADLRARDRWIGAKAAGWARRGLASMVGARHTWLKLLALALVGGCVYLAVARGEYGIKARFVLAASRQQVLPAPFGGEIEDVLVEVGDRVAAGQVLARLQTLPLRRGLSAAEAELFEHEKQADAARADKQWAQAQVAAAKARQLRERIGLLRDRIDRASIKARVAGTVVRGDLARFVGASVEKGQVLFEVAPIESLRAELSVPEDQIADLLAARQRGEVRGTLAAASYPDRRIEIVIDRVHPLAEEEDGQTVFRVRATLARTDDWMRPGMEGVAHVSLERRRLAWIWTRRLVNWLRLRLWL